MHIHFQHLSWLNCSSKLHIKHTHEVRNSALSEQPIEKWNHTSLCLHNTTVMSHFSKERKLILWDFVPSQQGDGGDLCSANILENRTWIN